MSGSFTVDIRTDNIQFVSCLRDCCLFPLFHIESVDSFADNDRTVFFVDRFQ